MNSIKNKILITAISALLLLPFIVSAQGLGERVRNFYEFTLGIGGALALLMIVFGAIYITVSGGSPDRQKEGKSYITSAIWGLVLLFGAVLVLNTINPQLTQNLGIRSLTPIPEFEDEEVYCENVSPSIPMCGTPGNPDSPYPFENGEPQCCIEAPSNNECPQSQVDDCVSRNGETLNSEEEFPDVFDCSIGRGEACFNEVYFVNDEIDTSTGNRKVITLEEGTTIYYQAAYPENGGPEDGECGIYAWETPDGENHKQRTTGLVKCDY